MKKPHEIHKEKLQKRAENSDKVFKTPSQRKSERRIAYEPWDKHVPKYCEQHLEQMARREMKARGLCD